MAKIKHLLYLTYCVSILVVIAISWVGAFNVLEINKTADLQIYVKGAEFYGISYFEPLAGAILEMMRYISEGLKFNSFVSVFIAITICLNIAFVRLNSIHLKIFFLFSLVPMLSVVNSRLGLFFMLLPFLNSARLYTFSMLIHWNFAFLNLIEFVKKIKYFVVFVLVVMPFIVYFGYFNFAIEKISYYFLQEVEFGYGVVLELFCLCYLFINIYKDNDISRRVLIVFYFFCLFCIFMGLSVVAGRLIVFSLIINFVDLKDKKIFRLKRLQLLCLYSVMSYEFYRFYSMTDAGSWVLFP